MRETGRFIIEFSGILIALGGLYDLFTPRLPLNLAVICGRNTAAEKLTRELLRALGGALLGIGITVALLAQMCKDFIPHNILTVVILLVLPAEGVNAFAMRRVGSPYGIPLAFATLAVLGVIFSWTVSGR